MNRIMNKKEIANELCKRMRTFKTRIKTSSRDVSFRNRLLKREAIWVLEILESIIIDNMNMATPDEKSEFSFSKGFVLGGYYMPEREVRHPRHGHTVVSPAKIVPYAQFKDTFRYKMTRFSEENECTND